MIGWIYLAVFWFIILYSASCDVFTTARIPFIQKELTHIRMKEMNPLGIIFAIGIKIPLINIAWMFILLGYTLIGFSMGFFFAGLWMCAATYNVTTIKMAIKDNADIAIEKRTTEIKQEYMLKMLETKIKTKDMIITHMKQNTHIVPIKEE